MRKYTLKERSAVALKVLGGFFAMLVFAWLLVMVAAVQDGSAQGIPPRVQTLQTIKPIEPAPISQVERLRMDIVNATDAWGRVNAKKIKDPGPYWLPPNARPGRLIEGLPDSSMYWLPPTPRTGRIIDGVPDSGTYSLPNNYRPGKLITGPSR